MLKNLVLIRLRSFLGGAKGKDGKSASKGKMIVFALLMLYVVATFAFLSGTYAAIFAPMCIAFGVEWLFFGMYFLITFTVIFVLSIFETKSQMFECRDNELLMSMPVKPGYIMLSRLLSVLVLNFVEALTVIAPAIGVYLYHGGSVKAIFGSILLIAATVLTATVLSAAVGYFIAYLTSKFNKNSFITLGFTIAFLVIYFIAYDKLLTGITALEGEGAADAIASLSEKVGFLRYLGDAAMLSPVPLVLFVLLAAATFALGYFLLSRNYLGIISKSHRAAKKRFKGVKADIGTPLGALCKKELSRFFSSAAYMLNGGLGVIFKLFFTVVILINIGSIESFAAELLLAGIDMRQILPAVALGLPIAMAGTVSVSCSALSLEGKSLWIIKSSPVKAMDLIHAKLFPHLIISLPTTFIMSVCTWIAAGADILYLPFVIAAPLFADIFFACFGLFVNILMPKFDYENEAQVVKQSGAAFIGVLLGMILGIGVLVLAVFAAIKLGGLFASLIITLAMLVLALVFYLLLTGIGRRKLEKI